MCNFHRSHSLHVKHCRKNTLYHVARYCLFPDLHIECEHIYLFYSWIRRLNWNITKILHTNYVNRSPRLSRCWNRSWPESTPASRSKECWILLKDELIQRPKRTIENGEIAVLSHLLTNMLLFWQISVKVVLLGCVWLCFWSLTKSYLFLYNVPFIEFNEWIISQISVNF